MNIRNIIFFVIQIAMFFLSSTGVNGQLMTEKYIDLNRWIEEGSIERIITTKAGYAALGVIIQEECKGKTTVDDKCYMPFVIYFDENYNLGWYKTLDIKGLSNTGEVDILDDKDGNLLVLLVQGQVDDITNEFVNNTILLKLDKISGNTIWEKRYNGYANSMIKTDENNFVMAYQIKKEVDKYAKRDLKYTLMLRKFNNEGDVNWEKSILISSRFLGLYNRDPRYFEMRCLDKEKIIFLYQKMSLEKTIHQYVPFQDGLWYEYRICNVNIVDGSIDSDFLISDQKSNEFIESWEIETNRNVILFSHSKSYKMDEKYNYMRADTLIYNIGAVNLNGGILWKKNIFKQGFESNNKQWFSELVFFKDRKFSLYTSSKLNITEYKFDQAKSIEQTKIPLSYKVVYGSKIKKIVTKSDGKILIISAYEYKNGETGFCFMEFLK